MKTVHFATSNKWKFQQAEEYFAGRGIKIEHFNIDIPESRSEDVLEVAKEKIDIAYNKIRKPVFVLDAAFYIKALDDFPKTYVKFADTYIGAEGVLKLLSDKENRRWEFPNVICYKDEKEEKHFIGTVKGTFAKELSLNPNYGIRSFERLQIPEGYNKTFSDMTEEELKNFDEKSWSPVVFDTFMEYLKSEKGTARG